MSAALLSLSLALAADAFAAALIQGVAARGKPGALGRTALATGVMFGGAQGIMPLVGWSLSLTLAGALASIDHWAAFAVLAVLGAKLFREGLQAQEAPAVPTTLRLLAILALATSIDAAAAGAVFETMGFAPLFAASAIAAVTALLSAAGVYIGAAVGAVLGRPAALLGGAALIGLGVKVLIDHRAFG